LQVATLGQILNISRAAQIVLFELGYLPNLSNGYTLQYIHVSCSYPDKKSTDGKYRYSDFAQIFKRQKI
jgi:hypothetical protein